MNAQPDGDAPAADGRVGERADVAAMDADRSVAAGRQRALRPAISRVATRHGPRRSAQSARSRAER